MTASATLLRMAETTTRQLAGAVIRGERERLGLSQLEAAKRWKMSRPTLARLENGVEVSDWAYRHVEGALRLPRRFFALLIDGDRERIGRLEAIEPDLRQYVLDELEAIMDAAPPKRRASDRRS